MKIIKIFFWLLFGKEPTILQIILTVAVGLLSGSIIYTNSGSNISLAISAFDICGGIVTNSCQSTRKYWAILPFFVAPLFIIIHLLEIPLLWEELNELWVFWLLIISMTAKLSVFALGQEEFRK